MTRFYVFRHGETSWNATGRVQGWTDIPLTDVGQRQAEALAARLASVGLEVVVSSDLARARATGAAVAASAGVPLVLDARLREIQLGAAEGVLGDQTLALFGAEACRAWRSVAPADRDFAFAGGEAKSAAVARFAAVMNELTASGKSVVGISTHGGLLRNAAHLVLPLGTPTIPVPNCAVHVLDMAAGERVWRYAAPF